MAAVEANAGVWGRHKSTKKKTGWPMWLKAGKEFFLNIEGPSRSVNKLARFLSELIKSELKMEGILLKMIDRKPLNR